MENFVNNHFALILTITIILVFALIGYIYDSKRNKNDLLKKSENEFDEAALENIKVPEGKGLAETVNVSKNVNADSKRVELVDETILNGEQKNN